VRPPRISQLLAEEDENHGAKREREGRELVPYVLHSGVEVGPFSARFPAAILIESPRESGDMPCAPPFLRR